jgi:hypothetical protein
MLRHERTQSKDLTNPEDLAVSEASAWLGAKANKQWPLYG